MPTLNFKADMDITLTETEKWEYDHGRITYHLQIIKKEIPMPEEIKNIQLKDKEITFEDGNVPGDWSHEHSHHVDMPVDAFILYLECNGFVEMRQIYIAERSRRKGFGSKIMKAYEDKVKELGYDMSAVRALFGENDPEHPFQQFLINRGYEVDPDFPHNHGLGPEVWVKKL